MSRNARYASPSEAARRLGVSVKALRLYEARGLLAPARTAAGWRVYGPDEMKRAADIVMLRSLGLSLAQAGRALDDPGGLEAALSGHQTRLEDRMRQLGDTLERVSELKAGSDQPPLATGIIAAFDLPWPWNGERFELREIGPINYIVGPLFSGKTRLAMRLAEILPGGVFVGLERLEDDAAVARARMAADPGLGARVARSLEQLREDGAAPTDALIALVAALEAAAPGIPVIDMIEQGLERTTQEALMVWLRRRETEARPVFCLTRSHSILDLALARPRETIIFCPANHSPPSQVAPYPGAPGYEGVATCLGSPEARARTAGVVARRVSVA